MEDKKNKTWYQNKTKYNDEYLKKTYKKYLIRVNINTEDNIIEHLDKIENKNEYFKKLIRDDISKTKK